MSADFWAGYLSGALGIIVGNPLDIVKVRLQAGRTHGHVAEIAQGRALSGWLRGAAAPILGYGALNSLLFMTYNRSLKVLEPGVFDPTKLAGVGLGSIWVAGAVGGLASWIVSAPSEVIKCRTQLATEAAPASSYGVVKQIWRKDGIKGLYLGGVVTSLRDSVGYGFYFWSYELTKRLLLSRQADPFVDPTAVEVLLSGGIAGVVTWASIYPLDMIKTRIQAPEIALQEQQPLLAERPQRKSALRIARDVYHAEGIAPFYRGLGVCSLRAFIVNAVQVSLLCIVSVSNG